MLMSAYKRSGVLPLMEKNSVDDDSVKEDYEKASTYYDKHRHLLVRISLNMAIALSMMISLGSGLSMWNFDIAKGKNNGPNNYVLLMFGFSSLCFIFMILINVFYTKMLEVTKSTNKQFTKL